MTSQFLPTTRHPRKKYFKPSKTAWFGSNSDIIINMGIQWSCHCKCFFLVRIVTRAYTEIWGGGKLRNNNNKGSRSNVSKHELVYGESSSNARDAPNVCLSFVLLFTIFIIVVKQKLVLQQPKNVTSKCMETLLPPPCIQFSLFQIMNSVGWNYLVLKDQRFSCKDKGLRKF